MSNVSLAKPGANTGAIISCTKLGVAGTDFFLKVMEWDTDVLIPADETSGDGDTSPSFDSANWTYTTAFLTGFMPASSVTGNWNMIGNLATAAKNPLAASLKIFHADTQVLTIPKGLIVRCRVRGRRSSGNLGMSMIIRATDTIASWGSS